MANYSYRVVNDVDWVYVPTADSHEITAAGGYLVFFNEDGDEVSVVRNWNEVRNIEDES